MGQSDPKSGMKSLGRKHGTSRPGRDLLVRDGLGAKSPGTIRRIRTHRLV